jgi:hypothetical protein
MVAPAAPSRISAWRRLTSETDLPLWLMAEC